MDLHHIIDRIDRLEENIRPSRGFVYHAEKLILPFVGIILSAAIAISSYYISKIQMERDERNAILDRKHAKELELADQDLALTLDAFRAIGANESGLVRACAIADLAQPVRADDLRRAIERVSGKSCEDIGAPEPVETAETNASAATPQCDEAKLNVDWVLFGDKGAQGTYAFGRATGLDPYTAILQAQGHNPNAQASITRCEAWTRAYLSGLGIK